MLSRFNLISVSNCKRLEWFLLDDKTISLSVNIIFAILYVRLVQIYSDKFVFYAINDLINFSFQSTKLEKLLCPINKKFFETLIKKKLLWEVIEKHMSMLIKELPKSLTWRPIDRGQPFYWWTTNFWLILNQTYYISLLRDPIPSKVLQKFSKKNHFQAEILFLLKLICFIELPTPYDNFMYCRMNLYCCWRQKIG